MDSFGFIQGWVDLWFLPLFWFPDMETNWVTFSFLANFWGGLWIYKEDCKVSKYYYGLIPLTRNKQKHCTQSQRLCCLASVVFACLSSFREINYRLLILDYFKVTEMAKFLWTFFILYALSNRTLDELLSAAFINNIAEVYQEMAFN